MNTLIEKQYWARHRVRYWWNKACDAHAYSDNDRARSLIPTVEFSNRMTSTAGLAYSNRRHIKLSNHFLLNESESEYDQTIGHEVAHIFADRHYGTRCRHNQLWRKTMNAIGLEARRCHDYASASCKRQERKPYTCQCGHTHKFSTNRIGRMRNGRQYQCSICQHLITYEKVNQYV